MISELDLKINRFYLNSLKEEKIVHLCDGNKKPTC